MKRNVPIVICDICGKQCHSTTIKQHKRTHNIDIAKKPKKIIKYALNHDGLICQFCGKECKNRNSLCNHERLCSKNPNKQENGSGILIYNNRVKNNEITTWNKGQTKETNASIAKGVETLLKHIEDGTVKVIKYKHTAKDKEKISKARIKQISEGKSNSVGLKGRYKDIWCDSSYELIYLVYCLDNNINIIRNKDYFPYFYNNEKHNYLPDFYLPDTDTYIELKGRNIYYDEGIVECKKQAVINTEHNYKLLFIEDIIEYQKW